jgi:hypothetical protein
MAAKFKMATKTKFAYVAKKVSSPWDFWPLRLFVLQVFGWKKIKKILGSFKIKMAAQFKMAAKI